MTAANLNPPLSARRLGGFILRHWYLVRGSGPRLIELIYWPTVQMTLWGFVQTYFAQQAGIFAHGFGTFIAGVMLWDLLFRGQLGLSLSFFEEIWSRNLGHLLVSPMRPIEFLSGLMIASLIRSLIGMVPTSLLAIWFFGFNVYELGLGLVAFFFNLIVFGWAIGLVVSGLVLVFGQGAESLAWAVSFLFAPIIGVYYPVTILPDWIEWVSYLLPPTYVFEGMRAILMERTLDVGRLAMATTINLGALAISIVVFLRLLTAARVKGTLVTLGE